MNKQEVFDTVVAHLRAQGERSQSEAAKTPGNPVGCVYRSPSGLKCAAGCLITNEEYQPWMEGTSINGILENILPLGQKVVSSLIERLSAHKSLISSLQYCHDQFPPEEWEKQLLVIANEYHLQFTIKEST